MIEAALSTKLTLTFLHKLKKGFFDNLRGTSKEIFQRFEGLYNLLWTQNQVSKRNLGQGFAEVEKGSRFLPVEVGFEAIFHLICIDSICDGIKVNGASGGALTDW